MNYNKAFYAEEVEKVKPLLDNLVVIQTQLYNLLGNFLVDASNVEQRKGYECFLGLLGKIRINLEAVNLQLTSLYEDFRFKTAVNLIYRGIVDDIIMINYLKYFVDKNDNEETSLNNELLILHKEFLQGFLKGQEAENEYSMIDLQIRGLEIFDAANLIEKAKSESGLIDAKGKWKLNSVIRTSTNKSLKDKLPPVPKKENANKFISETERIKFLKDSKFEGHLELVFIFKYYSQFQHYSPRSIDLMKANIDYDLNLHTHCLRQILLVINSIVPIINYNDKDRIVGDLQFVVNLFNTTYKY